MHTFTLPSGPEVGIVEMTGVEEDLLTNQRLIKTGEALNQAFAVAFPAQQSRTARTPFRRFELRRCI